MLATERLHVQHGLYLPNFGAYGDAIRVSELARDAEAAGWDGLFIWDHVNRDFATNVVDPWIALAAAATATQRIRLGALVTPIPRRRPWKLARETASLDRLSRGRLVVGVGTGSRGGAGPEWAAFGEEQDARVRGDMLDEGLDVLAGLWSGEPFRFDGRHYHIDGVRFLPTPSQRPRIPIWVAGYWRSERPGGRPFRRAAHWDGVFPLFEHGDPFGARLEDLRQCATWVRERRSGSGPFDVVHLSPPALDDDRNACSDVARSFGEAGATWWLERLTPDAFGARWDREWPLEAMREHVLRGPLPT